jgi:hypothetical protein
MTGGPGGMNVTRCDVLGLAVLAVAAGVLCAVPVVAAACRKMTGAGFADAVESDLARLTGRAGRPR